MSDTIKGFLINGEILHYDYNALDNVPDDGAGIFWATYGTTTSNEIEGAIASNKTVALNYENHIYYLSSILDKIAPSNVYLFRSEDNVANYQIMMSGSNWQSVRVLDWIQPSNDGPLPLLEDGVSSPGTSAKYSRSDHRHPMPEMNLGIDQNDGLLYFYINNNKYGNGIPISDGNENGLTELVKTAILQIARKVVYIDEHGPEYYQELYDVLYGNIVSVKNTLIGCYSSNSEISTRTGEPYTATIQANPGYSLTDATVSITMGGDNVTGAYSNGTINIPNVTNNLVITVTAVTEVSSISAVYTQGGAVYNTATLDSLKVDLVVTAQYIDSSSEILEADDYTLTGSLAVGTSTITVHYGGKTATFDVIVTKELNGFIDGTYVMGHGTMTVNNNEFVMSTGVVSYASATVPFKKPISLKTGDAIIISSTQNDPSWTKTNGMPIKFKEMRSFPSVTGILKPGKYGTSTTSWTMSEDITATAIVLQNNGGDAYAGAYFTISISVNGEVIL